MTYNEGRQFGWSDPFPTGAEGNSDNHLSRVDYAVASRVARKRGFVQSLERTYNPFAAIFASQLMQS